MSPSLTVSPTADLRSTLMEHSELNYKRHPYGQAIEVFLFLNLVLSVAPRQLDHSLSVCPALPNQYVVLPCCVSHLDICLMQVCDNRWAQVRACFSSPHKVGSLCQTTFSFQAYQAVERAWPSLHYTPSEVLGYIVSFHQPLLPFHGRAEHSNLDTSGQTCP